MKILAALLCICSSVSKCVLNMSDWNWLPYGMPTICGAAGWLRSGRLRCRVPQHGDYTAHRDGRAGALGCSLPHLCIGPSTHYFGMDSTVFFLGFLFVCLFCFILCYWEIPGANFGPALKISNTAHWSMCYSSSLWCCNEVVNATKITHACRSGSSPGI